MSIEAMKQALEALEYVLTEGETGFMATVNTAAIDLRTAIEAAEKGEPVAWVRLEAWKSGAEWPDDCFTGVPADGLVPLYTTPPAAQPAPMQVAVAQLEKVLRYEPEIFREDRIRMELDSSGEWVKYADVAILITTPSAAQPAQEEIQRLSALVRAQQITIEKLEAEQPVEAENLYDLAVKADNGGAA